uniref:T-box transcription factor Ci-Tbx6a n=1 Tax=Ciona intestinalis TaxID=7719 RepID=H2XMP2_CIOIN
MEDSSCLRKTGDMLDVNTNSNLTEMVAPAAVCNFRPDLNTSGLREMPYARNLQRPRGAPLLEQSNPYISKFDSNPNSGSILTVDSSHPPNLSGGIYRQHSFTNAPTLNSDANLKVELCDRKLWQEFSNVGTEMIVTKAGRRMFPGYRVNISGMEPDANYCVMMDIVNVDEHRYKFQQGEWMVAGKGELHSPQRMFLHPDSPSPGRKWMNDIISFYKIKLSNSVNGRSTDKIVLNSMHRYQPRIHIVRTDDVNTLHLQPMSTFAFPQTVFVTVTAYQNGQVTKLKINNNPFAKGFRDNGGRSNKTNRSSSGRGSIGLVQPSNEEENTKEPHSEETRNSQTRKRKANKLEYAIESEHKLMHYSYQSESNTNKTVPLDRLNPAAVVGPTTGYPFYSYPQAIHHTPTAPHPLLHYPPPMRNLFSGQSHEPTSTLPLSRFGIPPTYEYHNLYNPFHFQIPNPSTHTPFVPVSGVTSETEQKYDFPSKHDLDSSTLTNTSPTNAQSIYSMLHANTNWNNPFNVSKTNSEY